MRLLPFVLALTVLASPAAALDAPKDYAGKYTLSGVSEGDASCKLTLTDEMTIGGWTGRWFALVHPGNRAKQWRKLHADWVELTKKARARADAGSAESRD